MLLEPARSSPQDDAGVCSSDRALRLLLQEQRALLADRGYDLLGQDAEQPRQRNLQQHVLLTHVDGSGRRLAHGAHPEGETVAGPGLLVDVEKLAVVRPRIAKP